MRDETRAKDGRLVVIACAVGWALVASTAIAQTSEELDRPNRPMPEVPIEDASPAPRIRSSDIPAVDPPPGPKGLDESLRVVVRAIRVQGVTGVHRGDVEAVTKAFVGRALDGGEIESLRQSLTELYHERGFGTSFVVVPDQDFVDGVLILRVVEGRLGRIRVTGNDRLRTAWVERAIRTQGVGPLDVAALEARLQRLQRLDFVDRVRASLRPSARFGESTLSLELEEAPPHRIDAATSNRRSTALGEYQASVTASQSNLVGWGDRFEIGTRLSRGFRDVNTRLGLQLPRVGTTIAGVFRYGRAEIVETPLATSNVDSEYFALRLELDQPLHQSRRDEVRFGVRFGWRRARSRVDGVRFSFSEGADRGVSEIVALRSQVDWVRRGTEHVFAARILGSFGLPAPGVTDVAGRQEDARFMTGLLQLQGARRLTGLNGLELLGRLDLQLTADPLLSIEQLPLGGAASVRGYRENEIIRDNGVAAAIEARLPVLRRPDGTAIAQLATFFDVARGWQDRRRKGRAAKLLAAVGLGLRITPVQGLGAEVYWGAPLTARREGPDGAQELGIHFRAVWSYAW